MSILQFILQITTIIIYLYIGVEIKLSDIYNQNLYLDLYQIFSNLNDTPFRLH